MSEIKDNILEKNNTDNNIEDGEAKAALEQTATEEKPEPSEPASEEPGEEEGEAEATESGESTEDTESAEVAEEAEDTKAQEAAAEDTEKKGKKGSKKAKAKSPKPPKQVFDYVKSHGGLLLTFLVPLLMLLQLVLWGLTISKTYEKYYDCFVNLDVLNLSLLAFTVMFVLTLIVNLIINIVNSITKKEMQLQAASTYFGFFLFKLLVERLFAGKELLISDLGFNPVLIILSVVVILYSIIRLMHKDIKSRICAFCISASAIALAVFMFLSDVGNFAYIVGLNSAGATELSELNLANYVSALFGYMRNSREAAFFASGISLNMSEIYEIFIVGVIQMLPIFTANIMPFVALSTVGYLVYGMTGNNYIQYYKLNCCKRVSIFMLVTISLSLIASIVLMFAMDGGISIKLNYVNIIITFVSSISLLVLMCLPWKILNSTYKRLYLQYSKFEGGK